jgi:CDP-paratose 2-epimerase
MECHEKLKTDYRRNCIIMVLETGEIEIMKVLISGICGFVGSHLARHLIESFENVSVLGIDNLARLGSEINRTSLKRLGVQLYHGDIRMASDTGALPAADWVIDAAAQPSVLAGRDGKTSSRQLLEHNLLGTINLLEYCRKSRSGFILLSTSRVYSIPSLTQLPLHIESCAFALEEKCAAFPGLSAAGIGEDFSTQAPISLYGATKLASEQLAQEYSAGFDVPVWINRCGVMAGAGQFGTAEQGIFSYWIHAHSSRRILRYLGFDGKGYQVRDALHPRDLARIVDLQLRRTGPGTLLNVSGGTANSMSLAQLTAWCDHRFGPNSPIADGSERPYDVPWLILDSGRALNSLAWKPQISLDQILEEISTHALANPEWLSRCGI